MFRAITVTTDSVVSVTSYVGDSLSSQFLFAGTEIYGLFSSVTIHSGNAILHLAGASYISEIINQYSATGIPLGFYEEGTQCLSQKISALLTQGVFDDASWVMVPSQYKEDTVRAFKPTSELGNLAFTRSSDATRTNSAGVIERTPWNLVQFSEQFDNAAWSKNTGGTSTVTVTANAGIAPNGTNTAERIQLTRDALGFAQVTQTVGALANQSYTFSVYLKSLSGTPRVMFGSFGGTNAQTAVLTNEWVRYTWTATAPSTSAFAMLMIWGGIASTSLSADFLAWGYQLVEGTDAKPYFATTNRQDVLRLDYRNADGTLNS